jgi:hypothetical protein
MVFFLLGESEVSRIGFEARIVDEVATMSSGDNVQWRQCPVPPLTASAGPSVAIGLPLNEKVIS